MNFVLWFIKLRYLVLKNTLWKDFRTVARTLAIGTAIVTAQVFLARLFHKYIFAGTVLPLEQARGALTVLLLLAVIWIYAISFVQSIHGFLRNFLQSPDLSYLVSVPIPFNYVFLSKFVDHIASSIRPMLFLIFSFLAATGLLVSASWIYFVSIIPIYVLVAIIPCTLGVLVAMAVSRVVSAKMLSLITSLLTFTTNVIFASLFSRAQELFSDHLGKLLVLAHRPWVSDVLPVTAGVKLFSAAAFTENAGYAVLFLTVMSALVVAAAFFISKQWFYEGWVRNQMVFAEVKKNSSTTRKQAYSRRGDIGEWISTEYKMALRNREMFTGCLSMLMFFLFATFLLTYKGFFSAEPLLGISLLITIAAMFNIMAISIPFIPFKITTDKSLWKRRYWLLKTMPLTGEKVFIAQCIMYFVPGFTISLAGVVLYSLVIGLNYPLILLSALFLLVILVGSAALYATVELVSLGTFFEQNAFLGNLMTVVLPVAYGALSVGTVALFLAGELVAGISILSRASSLLSIPLVALISAVTVLASVLVARMVFTRAWVQLEL